MSKTIVFALYWATQRAQTIFLLVALFSVPDVTANADTQVLTNVTKEAEVVWYTSTPLDVSTKIAEVFQKKYRSIRPVIFRANNNAMVARVLAEALAGRYPWDLIGSGGELYAPLMRQQLLGQYKSQETRMLDPDFYDSNGFWTAYTASTHVLGFNTKQVKKSDVPRTYEALLEQKWKGRKIGVDTSAGMSHALAKIWGKEKTIAYFKNLATQETLVQEGNSLRAQLIAAGEIPLGFVLAHGAEGLAVKGAPIDWIALEPAVMRIVILGLSANSPHPNAAKLFFDFVISREGQEILKSFNRVPIRNDVDPTPARLIRGYRRVTMLPEMYADLEATQKIYNQLFRVR
jgi:iron(III) transport system substrate-binding protein